ncbi:MAG: tRNA glutamyl-Q(34) synthetase GluQRS [Acidimicrobiales bacterium]
MSGRFAPSPTGALHLGNLRTALAAWCAARGGGRGFLVRMEDLDRVTASAAHEAGQLADLAAIGLDWDGPVVRQSERFDRYFEALATLRAADLVYPCYCTRREIREEIRGAASAPHGLPEGAYPGRCRRLTATERARLEGEGRWPAWRLRTDGEEISFVDEVAGPTAGRVDDVVLARNDGVPAYNLAVVVDDAAQGVSQVVRGDDLLSSTPRQIHLQRLLGLPTPTYLHVPLVLGADGQRLAKRHGAVTLAQLCEGLDPAARHARLVAITTALARTLGVIGDGEQLDPTDRAALRTAAARLRPAALAGPPLSWDDLAGLFGGPPAG